MQGLYKNLNFKTFSRPSLGQLIQVISQDPADTMIGVFGIITCCLTDVLSSWRRHLIPEEAALQTDFVSELSLPCMRSRGGTRP